MVKNDQNRQKWSKTVKTGQHRSIWSKPVNTVKNGPNIQKLSKNGQKWSIRSKMVNTVKTVRNGQKRYKKVNMVNTVILFISQETVKTGVIGPTMKLDIIVLDL